MQRLEKNILRDVWRAHFNLVGEETIEQLQNAVDSGVSVDDYVKSAKGGASYDYETSLKILLEALQVIAAILTIYKTHQEIRGKKPSVDELSKEVEKAHLEKKFPNPAVSQKIQSVIDTLARNDTQSN